MSDLDEFIARAEKTPNVVAIGTEGSSNNPAVAPDEWADLDITLFAEEPSLERAEDWLADFGRPIIWQRFQNTDLFGPSSAPWDTWLVRFEDKRRIDLKLAPMVDIPAYLASDHLNALVWRRDTGRITDAQTDDTSHRQAPLMQDKFDASLNELYWSLGNVVKSLARRNLLSANEILNQNTRPELLNLLTAAVSTPGNRLNPGAYYRFLFERLPNAQQSALAKTYEQGNLEQVRNAIEKVLTLAEWAATRILSRQEELTLPKFVAGARNQLDGWLEEL